MKKCSDRFERYFFEGGILCSYAMHQPDLLVPMGPMGTSSEA